MIDWPVAAVILGLLISTMGVLMKLLPTKGLVKLRRVEDCNNLHQVLCRELKEIKETQKEFKEDQKNGLEDIRKIEVHLANLNGRLGSD